MNNNDSYNSSKLRLDRRHAVLGGVCAGLASYFNIGRLIVRIIAIVATFTWWPTIIVYIALYFVLSDNKPSLAEISANVGNSRIGRHFKDVDYRKRIYKSRRDRKISGVCAGLANYLEISPCIVRAAALLSLFFGPFAIFAYIVAAIIMDRNPDEVDVRPSCRESRRQRRRERHQRRHDYRDHESDYQASKREDSYRAQQFDKRDLRDCTDKFSDLEKKLQRLEATITSKKFKLHSELKRMAT